MFALEGKILILYVFRSKMVGRNVLYNKAFYLAFPCRGFLPVQSIYNLFMLVLAN